MSELNVGLFGFGCVGQGFHTALQQAQSPKAKVVKIGVKNSYKERSLDAAHFSFTRQGVFSQPDLHAIIEVVDNAADGFDIVSQALSEGLPVVTANKKMVAENFIKLWQLQHEHQAALLYEAAVAGGIPIIRILDQYYQSEKITRLQGILNGSSNYILSKMEQEGLSYPTVLKQAQEAGFAEADPWLDVAGYDAKYKLTILSAHALGVTLEPESVLNLGIAFIDDADIAWGAQKGYRIKLLGHLSETENGVIAYVLPHFIPDSHELYHVDNEYNALLIDAQYAGTQLFKGKGAGSHPTGSAVLADVTALHQGYPYSYQKIKDRGQLNGSLTHTEPYNSVTLQVYLRARKAGVLDNIELAKTEESGQTASGPYIIGQISVDELKKIQLNRTEVFVAVL